MNKNGKRKFGFTAFWRIAGRVIGGLVLVLLIALLFGIIVEPLWNWLMPGIFGLPVITYLQAVAMLVLARLLFGGFGRHGHPRGAYARGWGRFPDTCGMGIPRHDRHHFRSYWDAEGKAAFKAYLEKISREGGESGGA